MELYIMIDSVIMSQCDKKCWCKYKLSLWINIYSYREPVKQIFGLMHGQWMIAKKRLERKIKNKF